MSTDLMDTVTYEEVPHYRPARRWLYRLSVPIRFTRNHCGGGYADGDETTEHVVVSWGRDGDTVILPADSEGRVLDYLGFNGRDGWDEPEARLRAWLDGEVDGLGCEQSFQQVRADVPPADIPGFEGTSAALSALKVRGE